jgi:hypothetical protein
MEKHKIATNPSSSTLELDSHWSTNTWGFRWNPSVEGTNSRRSPSQIKKNESKRSQKWRIEARTKEERGRTWRTKRESQEAHHKSNPGGHEVVRATIPTAKSWVLIQISQFVDPSHKNPKGRGKLGRKKGKNKRGEGDGGSLILFNRAITQSRFCP